MTPPELTADAPVFDVGHPVAIEILELGRHELYLILFHALQSRLCQFVHTHEPLRRELRLNNGVSALGVAYLVDVVFHLLHQVASLEVVHDEFANLETVFAHIHSSGLGNGAVGVEDVNAGQIVLQAQVIVVDVVSRSNLEATGAEVHLHILIFYNRHFPAHQRHYDAFAAQPVITFVVGVDAHRRIT